ncbi:uncharacterized protein LACBIDRAFT_314603 [Laccaria bicolor S238N-H82]|uniref:Predicted protein n=1 Tax=Laccaria bicolor (strain S238N-H82 / ATCC MYA-4686) TaxID=486041 RepID=B0DYW0_LACBS|nr:uncharacterized protein LACBIDRAFT_314603 [Laccaria bicolor S238N-H82]EDR00211.1 predicted protein [Laccaria bicolor S238N-H82]|eukprot:XP_001889120.1 predicted protein [Laccaria bicolor S238N-H82]
MATTMCSITSPESYETPEHCCRLSPSILCSIHLAFPIPSSSTVRRYLPSSQLLIALDAVAMLQCWTIA